MKTCFNHPDKQAFSICHNCGKDYCEECLDEGKEYYYCKNPECQKALKDELATQDLPEEATCPSCGSELSLSHEERSSKIIHCPECDSSYDFNSSPPQLLEEKKYVELLSSLNQGDIAMLKSILDDGEIDYYALGEHFLSVRPLLEPVKFYVNEKQIEEVKELLKNFDLHIWGFSTKNYD